MEQMKEENQEEAG